MGAADSRVAGISPPTAEKTTQSIKVTVSGNTGRKMPRLVMPMVRLAPAIRLARVVPRDSRKPAQRLPRIFAAVANALNKPALLCVTSMRSISSTGRKLNNAKNIRL